MKFQPTNPEQFEHALRLFDEANARDPVQEEVDGELRPRELVYAERLTDWVLVLEPGASEALRLAARCQHIRRWEIPRDSYARTREGYLQWKETLKRYHAEVAGRLLAQAGYPIEMINRVQSLNMKRHLKKDPECQTLEDALCLVFLQYQFAALIQKTTPEKMVTALRKSWAKMSARGRDAAGRLQFGEHERRLLDEALR